MTDAATLLAAEIGRQFRRRMLEEYVPRIGQCVELLSPEQLWYRPTPHCNAVANLLLHLEGNIRQWILAGIGGATDQRQRDAEFAASAEPAETTGEELMARLRTTVEQAVEVVEAMPAQRHLEVSVFQSRWDESGVAAVLHAIEHFAGHAGQIYAFTKRELGIDLQFYDL